MIRTVKTNGQIGEYASGLAASTLVGPGHKLKPVKAVIKSPLRYPGGKSKAISQIIQYIPTGLDKVCSPFFGGGSIELELSAQGAEVFGYDVFEPLTNFWQILLANPEALAASIRKYHPLTKPKFYCLQKQILHIADRTEKAAVFFVLNRASFSGTTLSGGMSPNHPRFTDSAIDRIHKFKAGKVHIENMDFHGSIIKHKTDFLYLDPPYDITANLYGKQGNTHKWFDHTGLAELLHGRLGWVLSYNDCERVRERYKGFYMLNPKWAYGMGKNKASKELLILSKDLVKV